MIHLEKVSERTFKKVLDMRLSAEQNRFVAPNVVSLAQAWLNYDSARPLAVMQDDEVVGFMMLDWDEGERSVGLWRFMIAPERQHKGYGRAALEAMIDMVRKSGQIDVLFLDYVPGNTVARNLYASVGFRENGDVEDGEIIMTLPLTDHPKVGILTADEEDMEDFDELLAEEKGAGREIPALFADREILKKAVGARRVNRLTLMGKTIGLSAEHTIFLKTSKQQLYNKVTEKLALK